MVQPAFYRRCRLLAACQCRAALWHFCLPAPCAPLTRWPVASRLPPACTLRRGTPPLPTPPPPLPPRLAEALLEECAAHYVAAMLCNLRVRGEPHRCR